MAAQTIHDGLKIKTTHQLPVTLLTSSKPKKHFDAAI